MFVKYNIERLFAHRWHFHVFLWLLLECYCCQLLWKDWNKFHGLSAWLSFMHHSKRWPLVVCKFILNFLSIWFIKFNFRLFSFLAYRSWFRRRAPFSHNDVLWVLIQLNALSPNSIKKWLRQTAKNYHKKFISTRDFKQVAKKLFNY